MTHELPRGWTLARVDTVGDVQLGRQRAPDNHNGPHMRPYLRVANVYEDRIDVSDVMSMNFEPSEYERFVLRPGDILLNEGQSKELVGRSAIYRGEVDGACFTNSLVRFRPRAAADVSYCQSLFKHYLRSGTFQSIAQITTNIAHLGKERFASLQMPVPPLPEQRRIVAKLDALTEHSRRAKAALDAIPALIEKFKQSVLAAAFRGDLTADWRAANPDVEPASELLARIRVERRRRWEDAELAKLTAKGKAPTDDRWKAKYEEPAAPDTSHRELQLPRSWVITSVAEVAECLDARRVPITRTERAPGPYPYFGANGQVDSIDRFIFDEELVLVTEDETFYGRTKPIAYRVSGKCWVNNHAHVLRAVTPVPPDYLAFQLMHYPVEPWLSGTTGRAKLTQGALNSLPLALAPADELAVIAERVSRLLSGVDRVASAVAGDAEEVSALDAAILAKAFRGELVPQDPSDEPASVLLERIRAERAAVDGADGAANGKPGRRRRAAPA